jgi:hypothetical protein
MQVKTRRPNLFTLERELRDACSRIERTDPDARPSEYVRTWYAPRATAELLAFRGLIPEYEHADVLRVVLARAARSARRTPHFDLDFPRAPQLSPYWCHKHRRECRPVERAEHFLRRYAPACARATARPSSSTETPASSISAGRTTASSPRRRTPG